jgi:uncharacterized repeat protein (TIGR02543 family)
MRGGFNNLNVTYELSGGAGISPTTVSTVEGSVITLAGTPAKAGYQFEGWQLGATRYGASSAFTVTTSVTFTAIWSPKLVSYSYNLNGGTSVVPASGSIASGTSFNLAATPSRTDLVVGDIVTYYTFTGWKIGNVGVALNANSSLQMPGSDSPIVIYAQWQAMNYNLNGGGW